MKKFIAFVIIILLVTIFVIKRPHVFYSGNIHNFKSYLLFNEDQFLIDRWKIIQVGMSRSEVEEILGPPDVIDKDKNILITFGDRELYGKRVENLNFAYWYFTGIDISALYIFDVYDRVFFINIGGT